MKATSAKFRATSGALEHDALPDRWRSMRADEVGDVRLGRQRSPKNRSAEYPTKYLRAANITEEGLDLSDVLEMEFSPSERERYQLEPGDVVLSEASGSSSQVGKPAIWNGELEQCCFQNTIIRVRAREADPRYLLWLFTHFYRNGVFARVAGGVGINHLSATKFAQLQLPIAPPDEQRRIVAEIEKQFTRLDAAVSALRRVQANIQRCNSSLMKAALEGRLIADGAGGTHWPTVTVGELLREPPCNGVSVKGSDRPPGVPALRLNAMSDRGFNYDIVRYLPIDHRVARDLAIVEGDFFVSRGNGSIDLVARGTLAQRPPRQVVFPDTMIRLRFRPEVIKTRWLPTIWKSDYVRSQIRERLKTTAGIYKISQPQVCSIRVPFPSAEVQIQTVARLEAQEGKLREGLAAVGAALRRVERLHLSVLARAFEGRLLTSDEETCT